MSATLDDWDLQQAKYETHLLALSGTLRTCPTHGNRAHIEKGYEGDLSIMALECGCWLEAQYYNSIDECVAAWNNQPQIDALNHVLDGWEKTAAQMNEIIRLQQERIEMLVALIPTLQSNVNVMGPKIVELEAKAWEPVEYEHIFTPDAKPIRADYIAICEDWYDFGNRSHDTDDGYTYAICRRASSNAAESKVANG
jgi:hypothetical protein